MTEFILKGKDFIALCDLLKNTGLCQTGGHAKMVIANSEVLVDNEVTTVKRLKIKAGQKVEFDGQIIAVVS